MQTSAGARIALGVGVIALSACLGGCEQEQAAPPQKAVSATAAPAAPAAPAPPTAMATAPAAAAAPAAPAEDSYDDELVLLAEGDPEVGEAPLKTRFSAESLVFDEMPGDAKYTWDFGDGSPVSHEATPTHTFEKVGEYVVSVEVVVGSGEKGSDEVDIEVLAPEKPGDKPAQQP